MNRNKYSPGRMWRCNVQGEERRVLPEPSGKASKVRSLSGALWDEEEFGRPEEAREGKVSSSIPSTHISNHPTSINILFDIRPEIANSNAARGQAGVVNKQSWPGIRR